MPNVLLILGDQHRADCIGLRDGAAQTPTLDRLSREGVSFSHAFTPSPICAPARQALLSGRAPEAIGALWNANFVPTQTIVPEPTQHVLALQGRGTACCLVGSWNSSTAYSPKDFGFECHRDLSEYRHLINTNYPSLQLTGGWLGEPSPLDPMDTAIAWGAEQVIERISHYSERGQDWFIRWDLSEPHLPCRPSAPFLANFEHLDLKPWPSFGDRLDNKPYIQAQQRLNWGISEYWDDWSWWEPMVRRYLAVILEIDTAIGRILSELDDLGQADDCLLIYSSDHGDLCGGHGMLDKHYVLYDDVTRVPLVMRWPKGFAPCKESDAFVSNMFDIGATIIDACQLDNADPGLGHSLLPLLRDGRAPRRDSVTMAAHGQQFGLYSQRAIRNSDWLYVWNHCDIDELYNVKSDPGQHHNLVSDPNFSEELTSLRRALYEALCERKDPFAISGWLDAQLLEGRKYNDWPRYVSS